MVPMPIRVNFLPILCFRTYSDIHHVFFHVNRSGGTLLYVSVMFTVYLCVAALFIKSHSNRRMPPPPRSIHRYLFKYIGAPVFRFYVDIDILLCAEACALYLHNNNSNNAYTET